MLKNRLDFDEPFIVKEYKCPVCEAPANQYFLRDRSYVVEERDADQFITRYRWIKPEFNKYHIYFFHVAYCPHCHFADETSSYIQTKTGQQLYQFENLKKSFLEKSPGDPFIQKIVPHIRFPVEDLQSAMNLYALAAYIQLLPRDYQIKFETVARLFLRISWLYRIAAENSFVGQTMSEVDTYFAKFERLQNSLVNALHDLEEIKNWYDERVLAESQGKPVVIWKDNRDKFGNLYKAMTHGMDQLILNMGAFNTIGQEAKEKFLKSDNNPFNFQYENYSTYYEFLLDLKKDWPDLPLDEHAALQNAITYFKEIIRSQIYESNKFKLFGIFEIIILLYTKIGDLGNALYFTGLLEERITNLKNAAQKRLERLHIIKDDRIDPEALQDYIQKCADLLRKARLQKQRIVKKKIESDDEKAKVIFNKFRDASPKELKDILEEASILKPIVNKYVEERQREKKKGIFQIFKM